VYVCAVLLGMLPVTLLPFTYAILLFNISPDAAVASEVNVPSIPYQL
jgi:hypothetical protein